MKWRDVTPTWQPQPLDTLKGHLDTRWPADLQARVDRLAPCWSVLLEPLVAEQVGRHLGLQSHEQGGLLIGEVFAGQADCHHVVWITEALASNDYQASSVSLRMQAEIWAQARARLVGEKRVVGWYHSHPDLGAFFSHTDATTQAAFFAHNYSLGWVVDPIRRQQAWFRGGDCEPLDEAALFFL